MVKKGPLTFRRWHWPGTAILLVIALIAVRPQAAAGEKRNQNFRAISVAGMNDMGKIKLLADCGNVEAQLKIADACVAARLFGDAFKWYSAAADQGSVDAMFHKGIMLLYGNQGTSPEQSVEVKPAEGLRLTYIAATNRVKSAWAHIAQALRDGRGCAPNSVSAYAWFMLAADEAGDGSSRSEMNKLALKLTTEDIRAARNLARNMKQNRWATLPQKAVREIAVKLKLSGVSYSSRGNMAVINNETLAVGESAQFMTEKNLPVEVTCKSIGKDGVHLQVEGESGERILTGAVF